MSTNSKSYFCSDLHLLANRSQAPRYLAEILRAASRADHFVLGGDIFDFRWAQTSTATEAVEEAVEWLDELISHCPGCRFHYILGNHDYHQPLIDELGRMEAERENLAWYRYYARLGGSMFLHGDVADRSMDAETLAAKRSAWLDHKQKAPIHHWLYDMAVGARLHKPFPPLVYRKRTVARRILAYLEHIGQHPRQGVRHVYFGHIHRVFSNYRYRGVTFHCGGAPIKGLRFRILEAMVS